MTMPELSPLANGRPGPTPLATFLSDRAGEETLDRAPEPAGDIDPITRALRALGSGEVEPADDCELIRNVHSAVDTAGPVAPQAPSRREEILDGAAALFAERGYHGASLRDISRRVGISHPGMLHHFASKDVLLGSVIDRLEAHAKGLLDSVEQMSGSPAALDAALAGPWDPTTHPMALLATLSAEIVNPEHPGRFRIARLRLVHEHVFESVLTAFQEQGRVADGVDVAFVARSTFSLLLSLAVREQSVSPLQPSVQTDPVEDVRRLVHHYLRD
ncbi:AcrR family transcriptional regulator [Brachybacterium muris]|uniref:TetR/AcrR family transcriptional regulator n=1 Tax=Brachybacterium muris TaxID=219301 RepID=UPI001959DF38|nr:TetR/AcrR family transcriptional regulator [Brachybacterium muris]MBM7502096.1 AcrR family transcriptional regulator [Brachybacterium muris]